MSDYQDLSATVDRIVTAAIESDMSNRGFGPDGSGGFVRYWGDAFGSSGEDHVAGPGQGATADQLTDRPGTTGETFNPKSDIYDKWEHKIPELFDPWYQLPDPFSYDAHLSWIGSAVRRLAIDGSGGSGGTEDQASGYFVPNQQLNGLEGAPDYVSHYDGQAMFAFHAYLLRTRDAVLFNYHIGRVTLACLYAEQRVWFEAQDDVAALADLAVDAMHNARSGGGGFDVTAALKVLTAVGTVAAIFFTGGAAGVAIKGVNAAVTIARLGDDNEPDAPKNVELPGFVPDQVYESLKTRLADLSTDIGTQESKIATCLSSNLEVVDGQPAVFYPGDPEVDDATDVQQIEAGPRADRVDVGPERLEHIGNELLPPSAEELRLAAAGADPYGKGSDWSRPGSIGNAPSGPWDAYAALSDRLHDDVLLTSKRLQDAADALVVVARDFVKTDEQVNAVMRAHASDVASSPVPDNPVSPPE